MADRSQEGIELSENSATAGSNSDTTLVAQNKKYQNQSQVDCKESTRIAATASSGQLLSGTNGNKTESDNDSERSTIEGQWPLDTDEETKGDTEAAANPTFVTSSRRHSSCYGARNSVPNDVFGNEEGNDIKYKIMGWKMVAFLMISEVVSNGVLALPSSAGTVGLVPTIIIILFLGIFGTYTGILLVNFKLKHPEVHNMGDAGKIMFGRVGAGTFALAAFSMGRLCMMVSALVFLVPCIIGSTPRRLGDIQWLGVVSAASILCAGIVGMVGARTNPIVGRTVSAVIHSSFYKAFVAITSPVFAFAGHFIFFVLMSEMRNPADAKKSVYVLQTFATTFYLLFVIVMYYYLGNDVSSPSFNSLPIGWRVAGYAVATPSFIISAMLAAHFAVKLLFVRYFRNTKYSHWISSNSKMGWLVWVLVILLINAIAFVLAIGVPIFNRLIGLVSSLFASWYSYGFAGMFGLHTMYIAEGKDIWEMLKRHPVQSTLCILTVLAGAFICIAGTYVTVRGIIEEYNSGTIGTPFTC